MKYIIGARGSQLSVAQTNWVISELKKGIFIAPSQFEVIFLSDAHTENDLNKTLDAYHSALKSVKN